MKEYIEERAVEIAHYIIDHNATVGRQQKNSESAKAQYIKTSRNV